MLVVEPRALELFMKTKFFIIFTFILAFVLHVSAQNPYPNELKEYKLFENEKLKKLKIGVSTRSDVNKVFGADCEIECDYDQNWTVKFKYFSEESAFPLSDSAALNLKPNPKYTGKLFSIILTPKFLISFTNVRLPKEFNGTGAVGITASSSSGSVDLFSRRYRDSYGLEYQFLYKTPLTNSGEEILKARTITLELIQYGASNVLMRKMFIEAR